MHQLPCPCILHYARTWLPHVQSLLVLSAAEYIRRCHCMTTNGVWVRSTAARSATAKFHWSLPRLMLTSELRASRCTWPAEHGETHRAQHVERAARAESTGWRGTSFFPSFRLSATTLNTKCTDAGPLSAVRLAAGRTKVHRVPGLGMGDGGHLEQVLHGDTAEEKRGTALQEVKRTCGVSECSTQHAVAMFNCCAERRAHPAS